MKEKKIATYCGTIHRQSAVTLSDEKVICLKIRYLSTAWISHSAKLVFIICTATNYNILCSAPSALSMGIIFNRERISTYLLTKNNRRRIMRTDEVTMKNIALVIFSNAN